MESKKRKASSELQLDPTLADLPKEILIEIFDYLNKKDLLNLTLICRKFNDIISDKFIDKLSVWFSQKKSLDESDSDDGESFEWIGSRHYTNIYFDKCEDDYDYFYFASLIEKSEKVKILSFKEYFEEVHYDYERRYSAKPRKVIACKSTGGLQRSYHDVAVNQRTSTEMHRINDKIFASVLNLFRNVQVLHLPNFEETKIPKIYPKLSIKSLHISHVFTFEPEYFGTTIEEINIKQTSMV